MLAHMEAAAAADRRARLFTAAMTLLAGIAIARSASVVSWQVAVIMAGVLVNTYPSVRCFGALRVLRPGSQAAFDIVLALLYLWMVASLGMPLRFALATCCMFLVAAAKYADLIAYAPRTYRLRAKILLDILGAFGAAIAIWQITEGYSQPVLTLWAVLFVLTQIPVFFVWRIYERT